MADRVLVTGGSGFVAGYCVTELLDHGYSVRTTVRDSGDPEKSARLRELGDVEVMPADLSSDAGWAEAMEGCAFVLHVASPFPAAMPKDEADVIRPAVDGTLRVLRAAADSGTVRRVVLTSSVAAIASGHPDDHKVFTEADWSVVDAIPAYEKSKTLAERAAWDFAATLPDGGGFELVVVNPGFVLGPVRHAPVGTSVNLVRRLLAREVPASPPIGLAVVDVRDLAVAHRLAMEVPGAAGNRYICAGDNTWMQEVARILAENFDGLGFRVPTGKMPSWLIRLAAPFNSEMRQVRFLAGHPVSVSAQKAHNELGWTMRPLRDTVVDTATSLVETGIVPAPASAHPAPPVPTTTNS
ncbi:SDR family oxidoreductase [Actinacidiphila guanduensis]|uniref:Nucleoside-diphosphate-sugar epimerase n=1 Tax=Actinacidiphila guanduensis TaxID=310781 RepID=A0A1H0SJ61_9ACTN|nr:aldehyde reductase [Actinacidiphila guanduensis]SDP41783.1 Nucleoside-diphosphate-sugar epimerase [Actinacidiphila guanduensis]